MTVYDSFKEMLSRKTDGAGQLPEPQEVLVAKAERFLDSVSLRHYISMTPDSLIGQTSCAPNPLSYPKPDMDKVKACCHSANVEMRSCFGSFNTGSEDAIKEFISWCALFPERREELFRTAFPDSMNDEDDEDAIAPYSIVFVPANVSIWLGDELPLPTMVNVLNASMYCELLRDGETELAKRLF